MKSILIVDDMQNACDELYELLKNVVDSEDIIERRTNIQEALIDIELGKFKPDVVFTEIKLKEVNGIRMAEEVLGYLLSCQIVFISGYDDYYLDVYDVEHAFFIRKPFEPEKVKKAWDRVVSRIGQEEMRYFSYRKNGTDYRVPVRDILYFEMQARKVVLHMMDDEDAFYGTADEILDRTPENIVRCHKGYIVNVNKFRELSAREIVMENDDRLPIGRIYRDEVMNMFTRSAVE